PTLLLEPLAPLNQAIANVFSRGKDGRDRGAQFVRNGSDKIHLQVRQLHRSSHLAPLDRPQCDTSAEQTDAERSQQLHDRAPEKSCHHGKSLRSLLVVESLDLLEVLSNFFKERNAGG